MRVRPSIGPCSLLVVLTGLAGCGGEAGRGDASILVDSAGVDDAAGGDAGAGVDNPDGVPAATGRLWGRDYETQDMAEVGSVPTIAVGTWSAAGGFAGTGGWRFQPDPIAGTVEHEDSAGWDMPVTDPTFPVDGHDLVVVSFMMRISGPLLDEIARGGPFWAHVNKTFDFKYWNATGDGEGGRNGIHFGESPPRFHFSSGGGGQFAAIGPDWRTLADQWVWVCFVVDMRAAAPAERTLAAYYQAPGTTAVTTMGRVSEDNPAQALQPYEGRGFAMFFSPLFGYWDDMLGRDTLTGALSAMSVEIDRVRITDGWPTGADRSPYL